MKRRREQLWEEPQEEVIYWEETVRWAEEEPWKKEEEEEEVEEEFDEEEFERELEEALREEEEEVEEEFDEEEFERELEEALREEEEEVEEKLEEEPREKEEYFRKLPLELRQNIIHRLSSLEDILNFCLTSKTNWYSICGNSYFWLERARQENLSPTLTEKQFQRRDTTPLLVYLSLYIQKYNQLPISPNRLMRFLLFSPTNIPEHIEWMLKYDIVSPENIIDFALEHDDNNIIGGLVISPTYLDISHRPSISLETIYKRAKKGKRRKILKHLEELRKIGWPF